MRTADTHEQAQNHFSIQRTQLNTEGWVGRKDIPCLAFKDIKNTFTKVQMPFISSPAKQGINSPLPTASPYRVVAQYLTPNQCDKFLEQHKFVTMLEYN